MKRRNGKKNVQTYLLVISLYIAACEVNPLGNFEHVDEEFGEEVLPADTNTEVLFDEQSLLLVEKGSITIPPGAVSRPLQAHVQSYEDQRYGSDGTVHFYITDTEGNPVASDELTQPIAFQLNLEEFGVPTDKYSDVVVFLVVDDELYVMPANSINVIDEKVYFAVEETNVIVGVLYEMLPEEMEEMETYTESDSTTGDDGEDDDGGNQPPTAQLTCSTSAATGCSGCDLPVVACTGPEGYNSSDPDGDTATIQVETDCLSPVPGIGYNGTPNGQLTGRLSIEQLTDCKITLKVCDDQDPPACSTATDITIAVQSSQLTGMTFGASTLNSSCQLAVPITVGRVGISPYADLDTYAGKVDGSSSGVTFTTPVGTATEITTSLQKTVATAAASYNVNFSGSSTLGTSVSGNTSISISSGSVALYEPPALPQSPTVANVPDQGRQPPPARCHQCTGNRIQISAGDTAICALLPTGEIRCAGHYNNIGAGLVANQPNPVYQLFSGTNQSTNRVNNALSINYFHSHGCMILSTTETLCVGWGTSGQLGQGETNSEYNPQYVLTSGTNQSTNRHTGFIQVGPGYYHTCAVLSTTEVMCWGDNQASTSGNTLGLGLQGGAANVQKTHPEYVLSSGSNQSTNRLTGAVQVSSGYEFSCALLTSGKVMCWGENGYGELGNGSSTDADNPTYVLTSGSNQSKDHLTNVRQLACQSRGCCALLATTEVMCWGYYDDGRLGHGLATASNTTNPVYVLTSGTDQDVNRLTGAVAIASADEHSCVMLEDGKAMCWGNGSSRQIGDGNSNSSNPNPRYVLTSGNDQTTNHLTGVTAIDVTEDASCALLTTGEIMCWGSEWYGGLGNGQTSGYEANPVYVLSTGTNQSTNHESITLPSCTAYTID